MICVKWEGVRERERVQYQCFGASRGVTEGGRGGGVGQVRLGSVSSTLIKVSTL